MLSKGLVKRVLLIAGDGIIFWSSLYLALLLRRPDITDFSYFEAHIYNFVPLFVFYLAAMFAVGFYDIPDFSQKAQKIKYVGIISLIYVFLGNTLFYLFPSDYTPKTVLVIQAVLILILISAWRLGTNKLQRFDTKSRAIMLGVEDDMCAIKNQLDTGVYPIQVVKQLHINTNARESFNEYVEKCLESENIDVVIVNLSNPELKDLLPVLYKMTKNNVRLIDMQYIYEYVFRKTSLTEAGYFWFFENVPINTRVYEIVKRIIDTIISLPVLIVWILLHPWVKRQIVKDGNPVIYSEQKRVGRYGEEIIVKKYRTMAYTDGGVWPGEETKNFITPVGAFLRKTRIDELPQIMNVIKGELSLVGPRTDLVNLAKRLESEVPYYMIRYAVTPGLSGWAQIMMHEQPQGIDDTIERLRYDLYYIKNRGILFDLVIALRTARTLLAQEGR